MNLVWYQIMWMSFNILLAIIPIFFGWLMLKNKKFIYKLIFGFVWLIFLPNTIYLLTDIVHVFEDLPRESGVTAFISLVLYAFLMLMGVLTFVVGFHPLERYLLKLHGKKKNFEVDAVLFLTNIVIAFGMVLGRFQRTNSWDILFNPLRVIEDSLKVFASAKLLLVFFFFAVLCNILYFSLRRTGFIRFLFEKHYG